MAGLNLKSIADLEQVTELTDGDYLLTVSGGVGKLLPAGNFTGGGGVSIDGVVDVQLSDFTAALTSGTYDAMKAKWDAGECPNVLVKLHMPDASMGFETLCGGNSNTAWMETDGVGVIAFFVIVPGMILGNSNTPLIPVPIMLLQDGSVVLQG